MTALIVVRFDSESAACDLYRRLRPVHRADIHSAMPLEVEPPAGVRPSRITDVVAATAVTAVLVAVGLQYYTGAVAYPTDIGGRPVNWLVYIFVAVAFAMMCSALAAFLAFLRFARLPDLRGRLFSADSYRAISRDGFLVTVEASADRCERLRDELAREPGVKQIEVIGDDD